MSRHTITLTGSGPPVLAERRQKRLARRRPLAALVDPAAASNLADLRTPSRAMTPSVSPRLVIGGLDGQLLGPRSWSFFEASAAAPAARSGPSRRRCDAATGIELGHGDRLDRGHIWVTAPPASSGLATVARAAPRSGTAHRACRSSARRRPPVPASPAHHLLPQRLTCCSIDGPRHRRPDRPGCCLLVGVRRTPPSPSSSPAISAARRPASAAWRQQRSPAAFSAARHLRRRFRGVHAGRPAPLIPSTACRAPREFGSATARLGARKADRPPDRRPRRPRHSPAAGFVVALGLRAVVSGRCERRNRAQRAIPWRRAGQRHLLRSATGSSRNGVATGVRLGEAGAAASSAGGGAQSVSSRHRPVPP